MERRWPASARRDVVLLGRKEGLQPRARQTARHQLHGGSWAAWRNAIRPGNVSIDMISHALAVPREIYASRVATRAVVYLDSNVWIDLAEARTSVAEDTLALARLAQTSGTAIFPLSYPAVIEFLRQKENAVSLRQGRIMDELSEFVSLRGEAFIRDLEIRGVYDFMVDGVVRSRRDEVFTATGCHGGDGYLEYPPTATPKDASDLTPLLKKEFASVGVEWLQKHLPLDDLRRRYDTGDKEWVKEATTRRAQALEMLTNADGSPSARKLRIEEHVYVLRNYIVKRLPYLVGIAGLVFATRRFEERFPSGSPSVLAGVVEHMPSVWLGCEMYVQTKLARGPVKRQDQFDYDHAVLGVPYSDAFATGDSALKPCGKAPGGAVQSG